jgi:subtilisin family serine protease
VALLGADKWQAQGFRGQGVKIAVLDTGFRGWRDHLGKDLPAHVTVRSFRDDGNLEAKDSQHGILCGEVIHAIAPDAELLFANWELPRVDQFLAAVKWAREQGARVISTSVVTPNWSDGEGGGAIHQELARILGGGDSGSDLVCFASAGNTADRHWGGKFHDNGAGYHEWEPGKIDNPLRPWGADQVSVEMYWRPGADYDLDVLEQGSERAVGHAVTSHNQGDRSSAVVRFNPEAGKRYRVRVRHVHGTPGDFHLTSMFASISTAMPGSGVCFPADGALVVAMGAVDHQGQRMWYSACGPNSARPKPDFVAAVPFPSQWRDKPFGGTSCACPQGAALAALMLSRHPGWSPNQVKKALASSVRDLNTPGHDWETGFGLLHLP